MFESTNDDALAFEPEDPDSQAKDKSTGQGDQLIQRNELEESVMAVDWSANDAWTFAAISYNGTFFMNTVPSKIKYQIII